MPTTRVTEIGHNWPDIFITGCIPPMQATTCLARTLGLCRESGGKQTLAGVD